MDLSRNSRLQIKGIHIQQTVLFYHTSEVKAEDVDGEE